jgi:uncharacterized protein YlbG (UPF0298 family)
LIVWIFDRIKHTRHACANGGGRNQSKFFKMKTVLLQISNDKVYKLIEDLEALDFVKILKVDKGSNETLHEKFAGSLNLSDEEYNKFQDELIRGRNEWEQDI